MVKFKPRISESGLFVVEDEFYGLDDEIHFFWTGVPEKVGKPAVAPGFCGIIQSPA